MNVDGHLAEFLSITGTTEEDYARGLLESHNGDLEASLASHFAIQDAQGEVNGGRTGEREEEVAPPVVDVEEEEEEDTTPVAPIREQRQFVQNRPNRTPEVVEQLFFGAQGTGVYSESTARTFDVDTGEEVIQRNGNASGVQGRGLAPAGAVSPVGGGRDQPGAEVASGGALGALFSPPMDIVFKGDFSSAMMRAASQSKWLLVNIQSPDEFKCLILNRDLWKDEAVQTVIENHFLFWQRYRDSEEGQQFNVYYTVDNVPYVVIIDPRSGERVMELCDGNAELDKEKFLIAVLDFLSNNDIEDFSGANHRHAARITRSSTSATVATEVPTDENNADTSVAQPSGDQVDADAELAKAIAASMDYESGTSISAAGRSGSASEVSRMLSRLKSETNPELRVRRSERELQDMEYEMSLAADRAKEESIRSEAERSKREQEEKERSEAEAAERRKEKLASVPAEPSPGTAESTALVIRMPDGSRMKRRFMYNNTIQDVLHYVEAETGLMTDRYELMTQFPRVVFTDGSQTLLDAKLTPNASLIVHQL